MSINVNELLNRVVAVAIEGMAALDTPVDADGKPYFYHVQESFPYFTARVVRDAITGESEDFDRDSLQVALRLTVAHISSGVHGEIEQQLYTYMPHLKTYFNNREWLQTSAGDYTEPMSGLIAARCTGWITTMALPMRGVLTGDQMGGELTLTCDFIEDIDPAYT